MFFSDAYLENRLVLVGRSGTDVTAKSLTVLKGKRVAVVKGYAYGEIDTARPGVRALEQRGDQHHAAAEAGG